MKETPPKRLPIQASEREKKTRFNRNRGMVWDYKTAIGALHQKSQVIQYWRLLISARPNRSTGLKGGIQEEREEEASNPVPALEAFTKC